MANPNKGDRIGAVLSASAKKVELLGYGVYDEDRLIPGWEQMAESMIPDIRGRAKAQVKVKRREFLDEVRYHMLEERQQVGDYSEPTDDEVKDKADEAMAERRKKAAWTDEEIVENLRDFPGFWSPHLTLDDGKEVWGAECWWSSEEVIKAKIAKMVEKFPDCEVVNVDIDVAREEQRERLEKKVAKAIRRVAR